MHKVVAHRYKPKVNRSSLNHSNHWPLALKCHITFDIGRNFRHEGHFQCSPNCDIHTRMSCFFYAFTCLYVKLKSKAQARLIFSTIKPK